MATDPAWSGRPLTTQEVVLAELRREILSGGLRPGSPIRPDAIASRLQVSRVPVREALKILEGEGQVIYRPHQGYFVAELHLKDLVEIYRIRELLEGEAIRHAVPNLDEEELERMREAMDEMESLEDDQIMQMTTANRRFHFTLLEAAGMPHLQNQIRLLWNSTDPFRALYYMDEEHRRLANGQHREIFDAAAAGDVEAVIGHLDTHRRNAIDALKEILRKGSTIE